MPYKASERIMPYCLPRKTWSIICMEYIYIYTLLERMNWKNLPPGSVFGFHGHPFGAPSMLAHDSSRECMVL